MLHELLLALAGYTGDFIVDEWEQRRALGLADPQTADGSPCSPTFKIAPDVSFIQPSERSVIENLLPLGFYCRELDRFASSSRNSSSIAGKKDIPWPHRASESVNGRMTRPSAYCRAVANGIVEILSVYRAVVLQVEQRLLADPEPILATVTKGLNKVDVIESQWNILQTHVQDCCDFTELVGFHQEQRDVFSLLSKIPVRSHLKPVERKYP